MIYLENQSFVGCMKLI